MENNRNITPTFLWKCGEKIKNSNTNHSDLIVNFLNISITAFLRKHFFRFLFTLCSIVFRHVRINIDSLLDDYLKTILVNLFERVLFYILSILLFYFFRFEQ